MISEMDFDFIVIDIEHTATGLESLEHMVQAIDAASGDTASIVRLPWNDPVIIKRVLDIGPTGVMAPMIGTAEEAENLVYATRYPPDGMRGVAGRRAARYGFDMPDYFFDANDEVVVLAQIETEEGFNNIESIAAVDEIDGLFMGPADLSANLGMYGEWDSDEFMQAVDTILSAADTAGTPVSTLTTDPADITKWMNVGFDFLMAGTDSSHLVRGAENALATFQDAVDNRDQ
jgi:2-keto-3-deoxy-L-rhamnonate aldolase RhmA